MNAIAKLPAVDFSLVIPCFNEAESLPELYRQITAVMARMQKGYEIIFVDDGSTDESAQVIEALNRSDDRVKLIQFSRNYGKSAALAAGFRAVSGRYVVTMDSDLQDDPEEIPRLLEKLESGFDLVSGWKKVRHDPLTKRLASKVYNYFTSIFSGIRLHDFNCGLKIYRREVIASMRVYGELHRYLPVIAFRNGFRVTELPVRHHARQYGVSKFGMARFARGAFDLMTISFLTRYKMRPLHLFGVIGFICFLGGFFISLLLAYERLFENKYLSNRPLLFLGVLLIIVGVQFFSIGLLGEMITSLRKESDAFLVRRCIGCPEKFTRTTLDDHFFAA
ncbi:MAG TPA: glycosyltransferase family 2 protein [bacterium]|nr:glycosyltransferase family 2 protein [bacterium]HQI48077.1 glycosyltransferase family 2 protein [bacterium]HQJ63305.1 glycosyltransferase family 2 protein [bacterium]